ncbi:MAG: MATE family efflux transporter [Lachnospiraceae bacterium]|nr:MATE family efflux transporter [Lachnospiraceae bacterium]
MQHDLTRGPITKALLTFAAPMILGNLLQQLYNIADTFIVGRFLGPHALAAVGSSFTLMTFLTSILLGLCMGSGAIFSIQFGEKAEDKMKNSIFISFCMIALITLLITGIVFLFINPIIHLLQVPDEIFNLMHEYLWIIFFGIAFTFLYNYCACLLRAVGNSLAPLIFLIIASLANIALDLLFVLSFRWGVAGAAAATVIAQGLSAISIVLYTWLRFPHLRPARRHMHITKQAVQEIFQYSSLTCLQQSVMNFGILMVQGLVNSFGTSVMAAFAAAVKIDSFAYMPVQDFGNAFSTFIAQNYGARQPERIRLAIKSAIRTVFLFCLIVSSLIFIFAKPLLMIFIAPSETAILSIGAEYLRIEGTFYCGIGCLFLLYGYYRAVKKPGMSVILTILSLGTRVALAYLLSSIPAIGVTGIWWSIPIGWFLADLYGLLYYRRHPAYASLAPKQ